MAPKPAAREMPSVRRQVLVQQVDAVALPRHPDRRLTVPLPLSTTGMPCALGWSTPR